MNQLPLYTQSTHAGIVVPAFHVGRSWNGTRIEDGCPCVKEPCGLVDLRRASPACPDHPAEKAKSMRRGHPAGDCPGGRLGARARPDGR